MSHVSVLEVQVTNLEALKLAAADCGLEFREGQKSYRWYGHFVGDSPLPEGMTVDQLGKCQHALAVPNNPRAYEIGLIQRGDRWILAYDFWNGGYGLEAAAGAGCQKLMQRYSYHQARMAAAEQGWEVEEETLADGTIKLTCSTPEFQTVGAW